MENRVKVAILGSGNIGTDLMYKILKKAGADDIRPDGRH